MQIDFFFEDVSVKIPDRRRLKQFIADLFTQESKSLSSLTYVFCTDSYLLNINREFLAHDNYTDIISFKLSEPSEPIIGEIYISIDRVLENASKYKVAAIKEVYRVMFHGALHLCGYKDKTATEKSKMRKMEDKYLDMYG